MRQMRRVRFYSLKYEIPAEVLLAYKRLRASGDLPHASTVTSSISGSVLSALEEEEVNDDEEVHDDMPVENDSKIIEC